MVPLMVLAALKPRAKNPHGTGIPELFIKPAYRQAFYQVNSTGNFFGSTMLFIDFLARLLEPFAPKVLENKGIKKAMEFIRQSEGDRGWYASPIGWIDGNDNGEFVIAIRSGLIRDSRAVLFAGSGIVKGSNPESEWAETELKFKPLLSALNGDAEE
mgnify:CR=1 FL=1